VHAAASAFILSSFHDSSFYEYHAERPKINRSTGAREYGICICICIHRICRLLLLWNSICHSSNKIETIKKLNSKKLFFLFLFSKHGKLCVARAGVLKSEALNQVAWSLKISCMHFLRGKTVSFHFLFVPLWHALSCLTRQLLVAQKADWLTLPSISLSLLVRYATRWKGVFHLFWCDSPRIYGLFEIAVLD
jgi:hypothetical protein